MNFQKAITISGKIYNLLERLNLQGYFQLDKFIDNYYPQVLSRLQTYCDISKIAVCSTNGKKTLISILNEIIQENNQTIISNVDKNANKNAILTSIVLELAKKE